MMKLNFYVKAIWDAEAEVYYSESDIVGLHVEAKTLEEFQQVLDELCREMIIENHMTSRDIAQRPVKEMIPSIFIRPPHKGGIVAA